MATSTLLVRVSDRQSPVALAELCVTTAPRVILNVGYRTLAFVNERFVRVDEPLEVFRRDAYQALAPTRPALADAGGFQDGALFRSLTVGTPVESMLIRLQLRRTLPVGHPWL